MATNFKIVGLGEALFDVFGNREVLGGAPLNVAVQSHALVTTLGDGEGIVVSRIGDDELGARLRQDVASRGMKTNSLQTDPDHPTGTVQVTLSGTEPHYEIVPDVAWDHLEATDDLLRLASDCDAVCFGTLAQRSAKSREAIRAFLSKADGAVRLLDCNLRQQFFDAEILARSFELATVAKLNEKELPQVVEILAESGLLPEPKSTGQGDGQFDWQAQLLLEAFALSAVVLTRGAAGTTLYEASGKTVGDPVSLERDEDADSVGAGDACSAGVLVGLLLGWPPERTIGLANHLGAFVASQPGATPELPAEIIGLLK